MSFTILRFQKGMLSVRKCRPSLLPSSPHLLYNHLAISSETKRFCILMNLGPFHTEVCVNMCCPACMRSDSIPIVKSPECHPQCPAFTLITGTPIRHGPKRTTDLLLSKCIPAGWLNPTVQFSWKEVILAIGKIPQITLLQLKGRHPSSPKYSLPTSPNAEDRHSGFLGAEVAQVSLQPCSPKHRGFPLTQAALGWGFY